MVIKLPATGHPSRVAAKQQMALMALRAGGVKVIVLEGVWKAKDWRWEVGVQTQEPGRIVMRNDRTILAG